MRFKFTFMISAAAAIALLCGSLQAEASNMQMGISAATASSSQSGYGPDKTNDNVYDSSANRWAANAAPSSGAPQWIRYDLGSARYVGAIELYPEPGYGPKDFTIETSTDDVAYTVQRTVNLDADKRTFWDWTPQKARYIRIQATAGFNDAFQLREVDLFSDMLPHRVATLSAGDLYEFSRLTNAGFDALRKANIQLVNPVLAGYAPDFVMQLLPHGGDPANDANYDWTYSDAMVQRFGRHGIDLFLGFNLGALQQHWPQINVPIIDEHGNSATGTVLSNPFVPDTPLLKNMFYKKVAAHYNDNPYVRMFGLIGPGFFGGQELYAGSIFTPSLYVYDDHAKARFREWLQANYTDLAALNTAWGTSYSSWASVQPPLPQRTGMAGAYDTRQSWSDLMFWLRDFLVDFTADNAEALREATDKPIYVNIDGNHMFSPMESQANVGLIARTVSAYKPFVLATSSADESFGPAAVAAAARFYGMDSAMDNANFENKKLSDDTIFNLLAKGIGTFNNSNMAEDFMGDGWTGVGPGWNPSATYTGSAELHQYAQKSGRLLAVDPQPEPSAIAVYNSFYSSNYRKGYRYDDYMSIYDRDHGVGFNVRPFASWAHDLDSPDIIDDFLIEDGALAGYKLLVTANASLTLTSDTAQTNLLNWISGGGAVVGFGKDSFNYKLNLSTRAISGGTSVSDWMMGVSGGVSATTTSSRKAIVPASKPAWLTSLKAGDTAEFAVADSSQAQAFTSLMSGAVPVLVDGNGNTLMAEYSYGAGKVLFATIPVSDSELFHDGFMGKILRDYAAHVGAASKISYDRDLFHAAYMGTNKLDDSKLIVVADPQYMANGQYQSRGMTGDPQYRGNPQTLAIGTDASLDGSVVKVDLTAPWTNIIGGTTTERLATPPQKLIAFTADHTKPFLAQSRTYGALPIVGITAGMADKPYSASRLIDGLMEDSGYWKGGSASAANPQTITADLGSVYPVSGMELYPWADDDGNELFSFEAGGYDGWTVTGAAFGTAPSSGTHGGTVTGVKGKLWADSRWGTDSATGTLSSPVFTIDKELLTFRAAGYDGPSGTSNQNYILLRRASDHTVLVSMKPPQNDALTVKKVEVGAYIGANVYLQVVDGSSASSNGWLGIDAVTLSSYKDTPEIGSLTFERGTYAGWTVTGTGWGTSPTYQKSDSVPGDWGRKIIPIPGYDGKYYATTHVNGNDATGVLTSTSFVIDKPVLHFRGAGYDGANGTNNQNYYWLMRASDNQPLIAGKPPQDSRFKSYYWDVSAYIGTEVYVKVEDGVGTGDFNGWIAFDDLRLMDNFNFETATWTGWTTSGSAFGGWPEIISPTSSVSGFRGERYATSVAGGVSATGSIKSRRFVLENNLLSFRKAGYDGPAGTSNQNFYYLRRASDNAILFTAKPPQSDIFVTHTWDVSGYEGTEVYFEAVDGSTNSWLGVDDLNWRGAGPRSFTVQTSTDGTTWSAPVLSVTEQGNRSDSYAWTPTNARYVRLNITKGYASNVMIKELVFLRSAQAIPIAAATASSYAPDYEPAKAIDGITESDSNMWAPIGTAPAWLQLDLGSAKTIGAVEVFSRNSTLGQKLGPKDFAIEVSTDGTTWRTVYTAINNGENDTIYAFPATSARYVRLNIASGWNNTAQIREVRVLP